MNSPSNRALEFHWLVLAIAMACQPVYAAADTNLSFVPFFRLARTNVSGSFLYLGTNQFQELLKSAEKGEPISQVAVGNCYRRGIGVTSNAVEAASWYRKAAEQGNAAGQLEFGKCLLSNYGVPKDDAEAFKWIRKSAEQNYAPSFAWLARSYDNGWGGVATNDAEAFQWYRKAAERGDDWAQLRLGQFYEEGRAVAKDAVEGLKWYELAGKDGKQYAETARRESSALAAKLTVPQVIEARRRASAFVPQLAYGSVTTSSSNLSSVASLHSGRRPAASGQFTIEAPMELQDNRPIVAVRVNDSKPLRLMFDSGSGMSILTQRAASKLKLKTNSTILLNSERVGTVEGLTFNLAGASYRPRSVAVHPMKSARMLDPFLDGILGADLLEQFVVELDYKARRIRLRDLGKYKYTGSGVNLLMRFEENRPYVEATILPQGGTDLKGTWLIDTGASGALYVGTEFANRYALRDAAGGTLAGRSVVLSGTSKIRTGEFNRLHIGHFMIDRPKVTFMEGGEVESFGKLSGAIGGEVLRSFTVILHYGRQQLTLEPNGLLPKPTLTRETGSELLN